MILDYLNKLQSELITGNALEHSYRPALKDLIEKLDPKIQAINEPVRSKYGNPDFVFVKKNNKNIFMGYVETKDIGMNLDDIEQTEQLKRYLGYSNLILTNYIEFRFFKNGIKNKTILIADKTGTFLRQKENNFHELELELHSYLEGIPERITNAKRLAEIMGGKGRRIRENIVQYLENVQTENEKDKEIKKMYLKIKEILVHDLSAEKFSDMYAQTIIYGLFIARYYDKTPKDFSREEAANLIPDSNPFLQLFFNHIIGPNYDKRLGYIIDELCEVFAVADVKDIIVRHLNLFGETTDKDPIIHFYEDFLKEYDPQLRKSMGAYYTPVPVVQFMIRAVDDVLKKEFGLSQGIASTEKFERIMSVQNNKSKETVHKVQILDPAVGTATFLNEIINYIHASFLNQSGSWESYVNQELIPRLYGFELMMGPYMIAHLKLAMTLKDTGINSFQQRLRVFLTNTLEEGIIHKDELNFGIVEAISEESKAAGVVKHNKPIMVVIGNPPYSGESNNKGLFEKELEVYKQESTGGKLKERNPKWINDDYVKFIRFAEMMVEKNGEGIVCMITNHGYIDNPTFRGMRWHLVNTFNTIYVLDLHGNSKKKETTPDGGKDENVFDIQQGVAIIIAVKKKTKKNQIAEIYKSNLWGKRKIKLEFLNQNSLSSVKWKKIQLTGPFYEFVNKNIVLYEEYKAGIKINKLFIKNSVGIVTARDNMSVQNDPHTMKLVVDDFATSEPEDLRARYNLGKDVRDWTVSEAKKDVINNLNKGTIIKIDYRPFDTRYTFFTGQSRGFHCYPRKDTMQNMLSNNNFALYFSKQITNLGIVPAFISKSTVDAHCITDAVSITYIASLYIYSEDGKQDLEQNQRHSNINHELRKQLLMNIGEYEWVGDHENKILQIVQVGNKKYVSPLDILDYVYAVLYSPKYRDTYKDFLKMDFPKVPPAKNKEQFWKLVKFGSKLRKLHLMEDQDLNTFLTIFSVSGTNIVEQIRFDEGKVWINNTQFFGNVSKESWDFHIGGYQPAQKWLKDRKGKTLHFEDIVHYQKIIKVQLETIRIMKGIDDVM